MAGDCGVRPAALPGMRSWRSAWQAASRRGAGTGYVCPNQQRHGGRGPYPTQRPGSGRRPRPTRGHDSAQRSGSTNGLPQANDLPQANAPAPSGDSAGKVNRFDTPAAQNDDAVSRAAFQEVKIQPAGWSGSANDYSRSGDDKQTNTLAGTNNGPVTLDYASFKVIVDRNIFDPNRFPHRPGERPFARRPRASIP